MSHSPPSLTEQISFLGVLWKFSLGSSTRVLSILVKSLQAAYFSSAIHNAIGVSDKGVSRAAKQPLPMAKNRAQPSYYGTLNALEMRQRSRDILRMETQPLLTSLNSESAEYSLKKSLPLMGNLIFSAINGNGDSRVKRNPFQKMKKAVFYLWNSSGHVWIIAYEIEPSVRVHYSTVC